jgi:hypothetical protein
MSDFRPKFDPHPNPGQRCHPNGPESDSLACRCHLAFRRDGERTGFLMAFGRGPVFPESSRINNLGQGTAETISKYGCFDHRPYVDKSGGH